MLRQLASRRASFLRRLGAGKVLSGARVRVTRLDLQACCHAHRCVLEHAHGGQHRGEPPLPHAREALTNNTGLTAAISTSGRPCAKIATLTGES